MQGEEEQLSATKVRRPPLDKRQLECYFCHKKGHFKSECYANPNRRQQPPRLRARASILDEPEELQHRQSLINPVNALDNALNIFDGLSNDQKDQMIVQYAGGEDFVEA